MNKTRKTLKMYIYIRVLWFCNVFTSAYDVCESLEIMEILKQIR